MATHKIKLEDKAVFLDRMKKAGTPISDTQITTNKLESYFEVTLDNPKQQENFKIILKQSPKINTINEMENKKKINHSALKEMIRTELQGALAEKKKMKDEDKKKKLDEMELNEDLTPVEGIITGLIGLGIPLGTLVTILVKNALAKGGKQAAEEMRSALDKATGNG